MSIADHILVFQNRNGFPLEVSGVPPDAFSETGQLWDRFIQHIHNASSLFCGLRYIIELPDKPNV